MLYNLTFQDANIHYISYEEIIVTWTLMGIQFLIGVPGNALLLTILLRHRSMHKRNNAMLINLAVADLLSLLVNMQISAARYIQWFKTQQSIHKFTFSLLNIFFTASAYCVVLLSYERFHAVSSMTAVRNTKSRLSVLLRSLSVWTISVLYGIYIFTIIKCDSFGRCMFYSDVTLRVIGFVLETILYLIPIIAVATFSIIASIRLKNSTRRLPGKREQHSNRIHNRVGTSKTLVVLAILILVSYMPANITRILYVLWPGDYWNILFGISGCFLTLNSALNPVVLYFLSSKFRMYFKSYLLCKLNLIDELD